MTDITIDIDKEQFKTALDLHDGKDGTDGKTPIPGVDFPLPKDGADGKDGIGLPGLDGKDGSPDTPIEVRDKLQTLQGDERLDVNAIKGLEAIDETIKSVSFLPRTLDALYDVDAKNPLNSQALIYDTTIKKWRAGNVATSGGQVNTIVAGNNITVDSTDPVNPIINAVPSSPDTSIQFNDGGVFGGSADFTFDKILSSVTLGTGHSVAGTNSIVSGTGNTLGSSISGSNSIISGNSNIINGTNSFATGVANTIGLVNDATVIGNTNEIQGGASDSQIIGNSNTIESDCYDNIIIGSSSIVRSFGGSSATGVVMMGDSNIAEGAIGFAYLLGLNLKNTGADGSITIGRGTSLTHPLLNTTDNSILMGTSEFGGFLDFSGITTAHKTFTFPNLTGTFVLSTPNGNANTDTTWTAGSAVSGDNVGGAILITAGAGSGTQPGGRANLVSGQGSPDGSQGGNILILAGDGASDGGGGNIAILSGNGVDFGFGGSAIGGLIQIIAGDAIGDGHAGDITINTGRNQSGTGGAGGDFTFTAGVGGSGGNYFMTAGTGNNSIGDGPGGGFTMAAGDGNVNGSGGGGGFAMQGGAGGQTGGDGGGFSVTTGQAFGATGVNNGGDLSFISGSGSAIGHGGNFLFQSGTGGENSHGGTFQFLGGNGGSSSGAGSTMIFHAGSAVGTDSDGGGVFFYAGQGTGSGQKGTLQFQDGTPGIFPMVLDTSLLVTALRTLMAPDADGIIALTSDIPTGSALTKTDDTNVTLTLGGSPTTALLHAASLTLGWSGTLATSRGGTGASSLLGAGIPTVVASNDLTAQSAAVSSVTTVTVVNDSAYHTFNVGGYLTVTAISVNTITLQVTYTDETSTTRTQSFFGEGLTTAAVSTTGGFTFPPMTIRAKFNTSITVKTTVVGVGSETYDVGGFIMQIN
jgi:hypothetical protein